MFFHFEDQKKGINSLCGRHNIYKILQKMVYKLTIKLWKVNSVTVNAFSGDGGDPTASRRGKLESAY
jgi:hypothetical protein